MSYCDPVLNDTRERNYWTKVKIGDEESIGGYPSLWGAIAALDPFGPRPMEARLARLRQRGL